MIVLINMWLNKMNDNLNIFQYVLELDFSFLFMGLGCIAYSYLKLEFCFGACIF